VHVTEAASKQAIKAKLTVPLT